MKTNDFAGTADEQLIEEYLGGNKNALGVIYNRYYSRVYQKSLSFSKNPDDAFDLTQDILMKAFSKVESFKGNSKFSTWLFAIAQNHCITYLKKAKNRCFDNLMVEYTICDNANLSDEMEERKEQEEKELKLQKALTSVPELERHMLILKYKNNYSVKDLQNEYNLSASAVKMRLMRARQKVEQLFLYTAI